MPAIKKVIKGTFIYDMLVLVQEKRVLWDWKRNGKP